MKTGLVQITSIAIHCPACKEPAWTLTRPPAWRVLHCPDCGYRFRAPAIAFRVGKDPR